MTLELWCVIATFLLAVVPPMVCLTDLLIDDLKWCIKEQMRQNRLRK